MVLTLGVIKHERFRRVTFGQTLKKQKNFNVLYLTTEPQIKLYIFFYNFKKIIIISRA
jgi:hypothetical protein